MISTMVNKKHKNSARFKLKNKLGQLSYISVMTGLLPPKNYYKSINEYPFVLLRNHKSDDDRIGRTSTQNFKLYQFQEFKIWKSWSKPLGIYVHAFNI